MFSILAFILCFTIFPTVSTVNLWGKIVKQNSQNRLNFNKHIFIQTYALGSVIVLHGHIVHTHICILQILDIFCRCICK